MSGFNEDFLNAAISSKKNRCSEPVHDMHIIFPEISLNCIVNNHPHRAMIAHLAVIRDYRLSYSRTLFAPGKPDM